MLLNKQKGITLLEAILALAIGSLIVTMSLRMYFSRKLEADTQQLKYNVDQLFLVTANYYRANCQPASTPTADQTILNPSTTPTTPVIININSRTAPTLNAATNPFMGLIKWIPGSPLVDSTATPDGGYTVQLNPMVSTPVTVTGCVVNSTTSYCQGASAAATTLQTTQAQVLIWRIQVSVAINPRYQASAVALKNKLGADCLSTTSSGSGTFITPCASSTGGTFLVWERMPSYASPDMNSPLWQTIPLIKQFNLQYTHDQIGELQGTAGSTSTTVQNYVCGG